MNLKTTEQNICCPEFDPTLWDGKITEWQNKKFVKTSVCTILYMPINFGGKMRKADKMIREANGQIIDWFCLSDHTSKWNMDVYLAVDKEIPGLKNTTLSGTFVTKVYEGPFRDTGKWYADFQTWCDDKEFITGKNYMWYTTCPKCAKKYGKNYVVIVAEIEKQPVTA